MVLKMFNTRVLQVIKILCCHNIKIGYCGTRTHLKAHPLTPTHTQQHANTNSIKISECIGNKHRRIHKSNTYDIVKSVPILTRVCHAKRRKSYAIVLL